MHNRRMNKAEAIQRAGSVAELARLLGITTNAISNWQDGVIPKAREWQLRLLKPEWFYGAAK